MPNLMSFTEKMGAGSVRCGGVARSEMMALKTVQQPPYVAEGNRFADAPA